MHLWPEIGRMEKWEKQVLVSQHFVNGRYMSRRILHIIFPVQTSSVVVYYTEYTEIIRLLDSYVDLYL